MLSETYKDTNADIGSFSDGDFECKSLFDVERMKIQSSALNWV